MALTLRYLNQTIKPQKMKKLILFACIGLLSTAAVAQDGNRAKPAPKQEPVKVAPVAKAAPSSTVSRVEPAPVVTTTSTPAPAKTTKKQGMTKVTPKTATATAVPVDKTKQK